MPRATHWKANPIPCEAFCSAPVNEAPTSRKIDTEGFLEERFHWQYVALASASETPSEKVSRQIKAALQGRPSSQRLCAVVAGPVDKLIYFRLCHKAFISRNNFSCIFFFFFEIVRVRIYF